MVVAAERTERDEAPAVRRRHVLVVGLLSCVTAGLALSHLTDQSLWVDEVFSVAVARAPSERFFTDLAHNGANMSLYLVFLRGWLQFGDSVWWLRLPSVIFAAGCVPAFFVLARHFVRPYVAVAGAALVGLSGPLLYHGQEARSYPLTTLLVILSWTAAVRAREERSAAAHRWYVVAASAVIYSHIIGLLFVAAQLLWIFADRPRDGIKAGFWITLLASPQVALALGPQAQEPSWIPETTAASLMGTLRYLTGTPHPSLAPIVGGVWAAAAYFVLRRRDILGSAAVFWLFVPVVSLLAISEFSPMFQARYLVMAIPGAALLLCIVWNHAPIVGAAMFGVAFLLGLPGAEAAITYTSPDWKSASGVIFDEARTDEAILFITSRHVVEYYWNLAGRPGGLPTPLSTPQQWGPLQRIYSFDVAAARSALRDAEGAWVVERPRSVELSDQEREVLTLIEARWPVADSWRIGDGEIVVTQYRGAFRPDD